MKRDLYEEVTAKIVAQLESGTIPWQKPWSVGGTRVPCNAVTNRPYSGINVLLFWLSADKGYPTPRYLTFNQAKEAGGTVRKGEHGEKIYFFKQLQIKDRKTEEDKTIPMLWSYTVFNVAQCENLPDRIVNGKPAAFKNADEREADADAFIKATSVNFQEGAGRPAYSPSLDMITMPPFAAFKSAPLFYATAFHELVHASGAKHRLDRNLSTRFAEHAYALEELVAEIGAAYLCAEFCFDTLEHQASYLQSWIDCLKSNPRAIFAAASAASKACEWLRGKAIAEETQEAIAA